MGSYIQNTLIKDEKIIHEGKVSVWGMLPLIIAGFIFLPVIGMGLIFWLAAFIQYKTTEVAFTNKRVIAKFGFISRRTVELNLAKVESMQVNQSLFGRMFNYGTLIVSGAGNPQAPIPNIDNPMAFRRAFMEFQDQVKN